MPKFAPRMICPPHHAPLRFRLFSSLAIGAVGAVVVGGTMITPPVLASLDVGENRTAFDPGVDDEATTQPAEPQPVIVRVNRNETVSGFIELEDETIIVVRTLKDGEVRSFVKNDVSRVVRLKEPDGDRVARVYMRDGHVHEGRLIEDSFDRVVVEIAGVETKFARDAVDFVAFKPSVRERYNAYKAQISPNMPERHLALCKWLIDEKEYLLAKKELEELLQQKSYPEAQRLLRMVNAQIDMMMASRARPGSDGEEDEADETRARIESFQAPDHLISHEDVNIMRVFEIDFRDPPNMRIEPETIRQLLNDYSANPDLPGSQAERTALYRAEPEEIAKLIFKVRARELYPQIQVLSEPHAFNIFRQKVHNAWLIPNCATSRCHGGPDNGGFFLHRRNYKDDRTRYTNFLILERTESPEPGWPLIDYQEPQNSLILQYALPRIEARKAHPEVPGWEPAFRTLNEPLAEAALRWIDAMMRPRPAYPVEYEPPTIKVPDADTEPDGRLPR